MKLPLTGGCQCGAIRCEITPTADHHFTHAANSPLLDPLAVRPARSLLPDPGDRRYDTQARSIASGAGARAEKPGQ